MTTAQTYSTALQNLDVFAILGTPGTEEDKQAVLAEFENAVWGDFIEEQLMPKLTEADMQQAEGILDNETTGETDKQAALMAIVRRYVPDAETVLQQYSWALKSELLQQRLAGLREFWTNQADKLAVLDQAATLIAQGQEDQAVVAINSLPTAN